MEKIRLAHDLALSRLVFGLWRLMEWKMSFQELDTLVRQNIALGISTFDHADIYGNYECEAYFGKLLQADPALRQQMEIVTKCGIKLLSTKYPKRQVKHYDTSREHILYSVDNSLKRLHTDYIDLLLIHRPDPYMDPEEVAETFTYLHDAGKVRHFGASNFSPMQFDMLNSYLDFDLVTNQVEISAKCLDAFKNGTLEHSLLHKKPPMAWSPFGGGSIFSMDDDTSYRIMKVIERLMAEKGYTADQWLLAWLLAHPAQIIPVLGTGKLERVKSAIGALSIKMNREEWFAIYVASEGKEVP